MHAVEDRIEGTLLGIAVGDRIGGPLRMALHVAESLVSRGGFEVDDISRRYLDWWQADAFDTGPTTAHVLTLVDSGSTFEAAARRVHERSGGMTAGCNPAHRVAPMAMCAAIADDQLAAYAKAEARLTHVHPLAGDVAAAVARLCRALIRGNDWPEALTFAASDRLPETRVAMMVSAKTEWPADGFAPNVLAAAVHFVGTSDSFSIAMKRSIAFAGPANYCPVLVGSIGGARWGRTQIAYDAHKRNSVLGSRLSITSTALAQDWRKLT